MNQVRLGIDVACRAEHRASLTDERGEFLWSNWRFETDSADLERLWDKLPDGAQVVAVMEPTRNAWVPLAAWLKSRGVQVVVIPPEQSADLRAYYNKHTKTDRLDSRVLARVPLLHPEGLREIDDLGPAEPLKRVARRHSSLQQRRTAAMQRLDALVELLGPVWADILGAGDYTKTALVVLERYADPRALKKLGRRRLTDLLIRTSRGQFREAKADQLLAAASETLELWAHGGLDFAQLAQDIASEVRVINTLNAELKTTDDRGKALYSNADPEGIVISTPGVSHTLAVGILGRTGDLNRFANLAGIRSFTGIVPKIDQSGLTDTHKGLTKKGDPGLRQALYLAAEQVRRVDPTLAARYHRLIVEEGKHHVSAVCSIAAVLITRIAACWRTGQHYQLRDTDGTPITETQGRTICAERYKIDPKLRAARRRTTKAQQHKQRASRRKKKSNKAASPSNPPTNNNTPNPLDNR
ncbi:MAG: IS110 family transposase [Acidimicrobiia bacterium]